MAKKIEIKRVEFKITAPNARWVGVAADFNGWKPDALTAQRDKAGVWKASATVPTGTYEYKFVIDGSWIVDPSCSRRTINSFGSENSVLVVK
ncbi:MAG: isoamylase early set domain-containing protein [Candidatus Omnitrophica bacterium]|nr:isoamylase early set domain-containing protein [Candidatus Omnitrophota bacterium]